MANYLRILFVSARPEGLAPLEAGHREQLERLRAEGRLIATFELADGEGYVEACHAADRHEAEALTGESPLVAGGACSWILKRCEADSGSGFVASGGDTKL